MLSERGRSPDNEDDKEEGLVDPGTKVVNQVLRGRD